MVVVVDKGEQEEGGEWRECQTMAASSARGNHRIGRRHDVNDPSSAAAVDCVSVTVAHLDGCCCVVT